jgi:hypothetical protein
MKQGRLRSRTRKRLDESRVILQSLTASATKKDALVNMLQTAIVLRKNKGEWFLEES